MKTKLPILDAEIAQRVAAVYAVRPDWPCQKGCDHCCRHLGEPLRLSRDEWRRIEAAMERLPEAVRKGIERRFEENSDVRGRGGTCPLLERDSGACLVYEARPIACRTYGFYRDREGGRYCHLIEAKIEREGDDGIVWGNHDAVERRIVAAHGEPISWLRWVKER